MYESKAKNFRLGLGELGACKNGLLFCTKGNALLFCTKLVAHLMLHHLAVTFFKSEASKTADNRCMAVTLPQFNQTCATAIVYLSATATFQTCHNFVVVFPIHSNEESHG